MELTSLLNGDDLLAVAHNRYEAADYRRAEQVLWAIVTLNPTDSRAWALLGSTLAARRFWSMAERCYRRARAFDPDNLYVIAALAEIALGSLRHDDAAALVDELLAKDTSGQHPAANRIRQILKSQPTERFIV